MKIDTSNLPKLSDWTKFGLAVAAYIVVGWILTGMEMSEAREFFCGMVALALGIAFIPVAIVIAERDL